MSQAYFDDIDESIKLIKNTFADDESELFTIREHARNNGENQQELDKGVHAIQDDARRLVKRLEKHRADLEDIDNELVRGTKIDEFCNEGEAGSFSFTLRAAQGHLFRYDENNPYHVRSLLNSHAIKYLIGEFKDAHQQLNYRINKVVDFLNDPDSKTDADRRPKLVDNVDWETLIDNLNNDAQKEYGAVQVLSWNADNMLEFSGDSEYYLFGWALIPESGDPGDADTGDPLGRYWVEIFDPAYQEFKEAYKDMCRHEDDKDYPDDYLATLWSDIFSSDIKPKEAAARNDMESTHNEVRDIWLKLLHEHKDRYDLDDESIKQAENIVNNMFDSSIELALHIEFDEDTTRINAGLFLESV